jgi:hypothetical protein
MIVPAWLPNRTSEALTREPQVTEYRVTCRFTAGVAGFDPAASLSEQGVSETISQPASDRWSAGPVAPSGPWDGLRTGMADMGVRRDTRT